MGSPISTLWYSRGPRPGKLKLGVSGSVAQYASRPMSIVSAKPPTSGCERSATKPYFHRPGAICTSPANSRCRTGASGTATPQLLKSPTQYTLSMVGSSSRTQTGTHTNLVPPWYVSV